MGASLLIVAGRDRGREIFAAARDLGFALEGCTPRELNRRIRSGDPPSAILLSSVDADPALALAGLRRTRTGAAIPVVVFGPAGGDFGPSDRILDSILDLGGDAFVPEPVRGDALDEVLAELLEGEDDEAPDDDEADAEEDDEEESDDEGSLAGPLPLFSPPSRPRRTASPVREVTELIDADELTGPDALAADAANAPMGTLHATLDRLEARLRSDERGEGGELVEALDDFGLDQIPDVEPDGEPLDPADSGSAFSLPDAHAPAERTPPKQSTLTDVAILREAIDRDAAPVGDASELPTREDAPPSSRPNSRPEGRADLASERSSSRVSYRPASRAAVDPSERSGVLRPRRPRRSAALSSKPARSAPAASPASESGELRETPLPELMWRLHERRFTGRLHLERERGQVREIWWLDGELIFVRSRLASERLVDSLLRRGVLTRAQYETARRLAAKEPRRAGQLLMDAGFIKPNELERVVQGHLGRLVEASFGPGEGQWSLHPGEAVDEEITLARPLLRVILDGVRARLDRPSIEHRLGAQVLMPRLVLGQSSREAVVAELELSLELLPEETEWIEAFDGRNGLEELLDIYDDEVGLFALIYALQVGGRVELLGEKATRAPARDPAQIDAERIQERLKLAREADYFELLGVGRDASRAAVRSAYLDLAATFADANLEAQTRERLGESLEELRAALLEARDILVDDAMRSAYLAHLDVEAPSA